MDRRVTETRPDDGSRVLPLVLLPAEQPGAREVGELHPRRPRHRLEDLRGQHDPRLVSLKRVEKS